jgi:hypothetical protein
MNKGEGDYSHDCRKRHEDHFGWFSSFAGKALLGSIFAKPYPIVREY